MTVFTIESASNMAWMIGISIANIRVLKIVWSTMQMKYGTAYRP